MHGLKIKELKKVELEGGYLIDGFPSLGFSSAIATESMIHTTQFELLGIIDSEKFPPVSLIRDGKPNYPTRIFVNENLKVSIFSSYLTPEESLQRNLSKMMLSWAKKHNIFLTISSAALKSSDYNEKIVAVGSTDRAREIISKAQIPSMNSGTIPGIPGILLNEGMIRNQHVIVILFHTRDTGLDFKASAQLCTVMAKLVPGISCDIPLLQKEAEKAELSIKQAEEEAKHMREAMYR